MGRFLAVPAETDQRIIPGKYRHFRHRHCSRYIPQVRGGFPVHFTDFFQLEGLREAWLPARIVQRNAMLHCTLRIGLLNYRAIPRGDLDMSRYTLQE
jgi:hypothetical protein